jgi:hypothetical protein
VTIVDTNPSSQLTYYIVTASFEFAARTAANFASLGGKILATTLAAYFTDAETIDPVDNH